MQICSVIVRRKGDMRHAVPKEVSVPEIRVLQNIHGADAVVDIKPIEFRKEFDHDEHREYLKFTYESGGGGGMSGEPDATRGLIARLFDPFAPLPTTLRAIGINPRKEAEKRRKEAEEALAAAAAFEREQDGFNQDEVDAMNGAGDYAPDEAEEEMELA